MTRVSAFALPVGLLVVAVAFTLGASQFSAASRTVPQLVGGLVMVVCALDILTRSDTAVGRRVATWLNPAGLAEAGAVRPASKHRRQSIALAGVALFVTGLTLFGVLPAVALFMLLALRFGAAMGWRGTALLTAAVSIAIWLMFAVLLRLSLFPGLLFGGEW